MLVPLSWLKKFVDVTLSPKELAERLTEVGIGVEAVKKEGDETIFELEITPNRPDWLSIIGIAREIGAIEGKSVKDKQYSHKTPAKPTLPMKLVPDYDLFHRWTAVSIANVEVKPSPRWMQERLEQVGLRPINNIVDTTNFVMFELGVPLHAFDYDQIKGQVMIVEEAKGGEKFTTVDEKTYNLPKGAIIIRDRERVIDLAGIKGGLNSGITKDSKNVFLHVTIDDPIHIRRTSQTLALRSEASAIYERGPDKGGTINALSRAAMLVLETAGGEIASQIYDLKPKEYKPWKLSLRINRLNQILGIEIPTKQVIAILKSLNLSLVVKNDTIEVTIPTYRNDLQIEEDLIEEVARMYGYNKFPKTIPQGQIPTAKIPYYKDYRIDEKIKEILKAAGFSEIYTYSLVGEQDLLDNGINPQKVLRVDNPVSKEYEYLRPTHKIALKKAVRQNLPYIKEVNLFELGKVYLGRNLSEVEEPYYLCTISTSKSYFEMKGILEYILKELNVKKDATTFIDMIDEGIFFEINYSELLKTAKFERVFKPTPKYPPIIEDLALVVKEGTKTGSLIEEIKKQSPLIAEVSLLDVYQDTRTFHIVYQHKERNLTTEEVSQIREKIIKSLEKKFGIKLKE